MTETDVIFLGACILRSTRFDIGVNDSTPPDLAAVGLYEVVQRAQRQRYGLDPDHGTRLPVLGIAKPSP